MLRLADNKVAESEWDDDILDFELGEMEEFFSVEDFGFDFEMETTETEITGIGTETDELIIEARCNDDIAASVINVLEKIDGVSVSIKGM